MQLQVFSKFCQVGAGGIFATRIDGRRQNLQLTCRLQDCQYLGRCKMMKSVNSYYFLHHVFCLFCAGVRARANIRSFRAFNFSVLLAVSLAGVFLNVSALANSDDIAGSVAVSAEASTLNDDADAESTLEGILTQEPQKEDYVEERNCISTHRIRNVQVLDEHHVIFNMRRNKHYLVQFKHRCFGLKPNQPISYEVNSFQVCKFDAIQGLDNFAGRLQTGQSCRIPGFQSISKEQVVVLKENLKNDRQRAREERKARREAEHQARKAKRKV